MLNTAPQIQYSAILDFIYPVGSYFITESSNYDTVAKVQAHFGGTWVRLNSRFLYATSGTDIGAEGGEANHTLTIDEMPRHDHALDHLWSLSDGSWASFRTGSSSTLSYGPDIADRGGSQPHNNMPPYRKVYMYRRTA